MTHKELIGHLLFDHGRVPLGDGVTDKPLAEQHTALHRRGEHGHDHKAVGS